MKASLSIKVLLRTPFKTLLTFLILTAASFALFSQVCERAVVTREMKRATGYYRGVCALDTGVPNTADRVWYSQMHETGIRPPALTKKQIEDFKLLPQVTSTDTRYMTAGISDRYTRISLSEDFSYNYTTRFVMEGTFLGYSDTPESNGYKLDLKFTDCKLLAGDPFLLKGMSDHLKVCVWAEEGAALDDVFGVGGWFRLFHSISNNPYGRKFADSLTVGSRYLFIGRWEPMALDFILNKNAGMYGVYRYIALGDQDTMEYCDSFLSLDGKPENCLETEEFSRVREIIEITNSDLKTFDIVYTSDMPAIPRFAEGKMAIAEGRALNKDDQGLNHCVVSQAFLKTNELKLGDKIKMGLCTKLLEQHSGMGAVACIPERYSPPAEEVELEIVGVYYDTDGALEREANMYWCYSYNTIFVPSSLLPVDPPQDHKIYPGEFSLVVGDAQKIEEFLKMAEPLAKEHGISLRFDDGGWTQVSRNISASSQMSLITTSLFVIASAIALLIAVYLFIGRGKREYAIMRALGTPSNRAKRSLYLRIGILSVLAIPVGAAIGLVDTSRSVSAALADIASAVTADYVPDASIPTGVIAACVLGEIIFLSLLVIIMLRWLDHMRLLELLQGDRGRKQKKQKTPAVQKQHGIQAEMPVSGEYMPPKVTMPEGGMPAADERETEGGMPAAELKKKGGGRYGAAQHVTRYIIRHMGRTGWKTALSVLLAIIFPGAMGFFAIMRLSYEDLYKNIEIKSIITNMSSEFAGDADDSDLIKKSYYQGLFKVYCNGTLEKPETLCDMIITNDISRLAQGDISVQYADGYGSLTLPGDKAQCLIGHELAKALNVKPGDKISLLGERRWMPLLAYYEEMGQEKQKLEEFGVIYTVIGIITTQNATVNWGVIAPAGRLAKDVYGWAFLIDYGEFVLADNERADELRELSESIVYKSYRFSRDAAYAMDTTELENIIRVMKLLKLLFPIAVAVSIFIVIVSSGLMILQMSREAAILRVLGTSKKRTRCMLALEQVILCITGLSLAAAGLAFYNRELFVNAAGTLTFCGGLYLLGCAMAVSLASIIVTRHKALELLQVKE